MRRVLDPVTELRLLQLQERLPPEPPQEAPLLVGPFRAEEPALLPPIVGPLASLCGQLRAERLLVPPPLLAEPHP